jgi:hypothetical protein
MQRTILFSVTSVVHFGQTMTTIAARSIESTPEVTMMTDHNFPSRLYMFLEVVETYDLSHVASWQPHGRGFRIHNPKAFVKITTPRCVKQVLPHSNTFGFEYCMHNVSNPTFCLSSMFLTD